MLDNTMASQNGKKLGKNLEIDWYGFFEADTDISKIFKSWFLLHYQKYDVFYALPFLQNWKNQDL